MPLRDDPARCALQRSWLGLLEAAVGEPSSSALASYRDARAARTLDDIAQVGVDVFPRNICMSTGRAEGNMPVLFSYNITGTDPTISNRIQSIFERLGWQNVGGSSYRYPPLGTDPAIPEDWFNCVIL